MINAVGKIIYKGRLEMDRRFQNKMPINEDTESDNAIPAIPPSILAVGGSRITCDMRKGCTTKLSIVYPLIRPTMAWPSSWRADSIMNAVA